MKFQNIAFPGQGTLTNPINFSQNLGTISLSVTPTPPLTPTGMVTVPMAAGSAFVVPTGQWVLFPGQYCDVQYYDSAAQIWRNIAPFDTPLPISSDGTNYRVANLTGCAVGAVITASTGNSSLVAGAYMANGTWINGSFTSGQSTTYKTTAAAGNSTWNTFVGGCVAASGKLFGGTAPAITTAGSGYTAPPILIVVPPSSQGSQPFIPATLTCTISGGAINAVTVTNQGAGYVAAPTVLVVNAPGDTTGTGGVITLTLGASSGSNIAVTAITMASFGTAVTSTPSLTVTVPAGSASATAIMNFSITSASATAGAGYTPTNGAASVVTSGAGLTATPTYANPNIELGLVFPSNPTITATITAGAIGTPVVNYGGVGFATAPNGLVLGSGSAPFGTSSSTVTVNVGGTADTLYLLPL